MSPRSRTRSGRTAASAARRPTRSCSIPASSPPRRSRSSAPRPSTRCSNGGCSRSANPSRSARRPNVTAPTGIGRSRSSRPPLIPRRPQGRNGVGRTSSATMTGMTDADELCLYDVRDGVAVVTLNRPDRNNAMIGALEVAYFRRLGQANDDREVRAIVVTGAGKSFCPGADLAHRRQPGDLPLPNGQIPTTFPQTVDKPLVAAINGACAGVGLVQALHCDVRFAAAQAKFTTAFARRGLIAEYGVAWLLPPLLRFAAAPPPPGARRALTPPATPAPR